MELGGYDIEKIAFTYWFYSEGPRGRIKKVVRFQRMPELGRNAFNLAFGDANETMEQINDLIVTNNGDQLKVLITIAKVVADFVYHWPNAIIQAKGSTPSRTRLYQMKIATFWQEISREFEIMGELSTSWVPFRRGVNYKRFLIFKKIR
jgi:hypothetical protein